MSLLIDFLSFITPGTFRTLKQASFSGHICGDHFCIQVAKFLPKKAAKVPQLIPISSNIKSWIVSLPNDQMYVIDWHFLSTMPKFRFMKNIQLGKKILKFICFVFPCYVMKSVINVASFCYNSWQDPIFKFHFKISQNFML